MQPLASHDPRQVGPYRTVALLGAGGMGRVYLGLDPHGRPAAVKVVRAEYAYDPDFRERFAQELALAQRVHGHFTPRVLAADTSGQMPWLATEYVMGPSLQDMVRLIGPLPEQAVHLVAQGIAQALERLHASGLVHRDLKPGNIMLSAQGPQVIDFGIARALGEDRGDGEEHLIGTPGYMAPESVRAKGAGAASDVFALGGVIVHALTGTGPFGEGHPSAVLYRITTQEPVLTGVPDSLRGLVTACLTKDPARRPTSAQVLQDLGGPISSFSTADAWLPPPAVEVIDRIGHQYQEAVRSAPLSESTTHAGGTTPRPRGRRLALLGAGAAALLLLAGAGTLATVSFLDTEEPPEAEPGDRKKCDLTEHLASEYTEAAASTPTIPSTGMFTTLFSPDGDVLAVAGDEGMALWDWAQETELALLADIEFGLLSGDPVFSPDQCRVGFTNEEGAHVHTLETGEQHTFREGNEVGALVFAADGETAFLSESGTGADQSVQRFDLDTGEVVASYEGNDGAHTLLLSPSGHYLAAANYLDGLSVWDVDSGEQVFTAKDDIASFGSNMQLTDDHIVHTDGDTVYVTDFLSGQGQEFTAAEPPEDGFGEVLFSEADDRVYATFTGSEIIVEDEEEYGIVVWEYSSGAELGIEEYMSGLTIHPDGGVLAGIPIVNSPVWLVEPDTMRLHSRIGS